MSKRTLVTALPGWSLAILTALGSFALAQAQNYPVKPIRLVVPLAPGGGNDTLARYMGKYLSESLGQSVVIENRTGGGGLVGGEYAARSAADGYTLIEGDILIPTGRAGERRAASPFAPSTTSYWPNGIVPYEFDENVSTQRKILMLEAMEEWQAVAHVTFVPHTVEFDWLHIQVNTERNNSAVGRQFLGPQVINIRDWNSKFKMVHELGHALIREFDLPILGNEETMADAFATHYLTTHLPDRAVDAINPVGDCEHRGCRQIRDSSRRT
jgi:hypothetical protein